MHQQAMNTNYSLEEAYNPEMQQEKKLKPLPDPSLKCPRCDSTNTKFCYYNNYSLAQPRYFCKGCRRYWTQGGSLRNVPVGGGCRKNKRSSTTLSSSSSTSKRTQDQILTSSSTTTTTTSSPMLPSFQNHVLPYDPHDLTFAFARLQKPPTKPASYDALFAGNANHLSLSHNTSTHGFLDILRSGGAFDSHFTGVGIHSLYHPGFAGLGGNVGEAAAPPVLPTGEINGGTPATIKEETCKGMDGDGKALMALQCLQVGGDGNMGLDNVKDYWGSVGPVGSSIWHGLVNGSLM